MVKPKVLVIDEDVDFCLLMEYLFSKKGYKVVFVNVLSDGIELIELIRPDIIYVNTNITNYLPDLFENKITSMDKYEPKVYLNKYINELENYIVQETLLDEIMKLIKLIKSKF